MSLENVILLFENIEVTNIIDLAITIFSILLLSLSLLAFKNTGLKKILYAAAAFGLFAFNLFLEYAQDTISSYFGDVPFDIIGSVITLAILILFFVAIVKRR